MLGIHKGWPLPPLAFPPLPPSSLPFSFFLHYSSTFLSLSVSLSSSSSQRQLVQRCCLSFFLQQRISSPSYSSSPSSFSSLSYNIFFSLGSTSVFSTFYNLFILSDIHLKLINLYIYFFLSSMYPSILLCVHFLLIYSGRSL